MDNTASVSLMVGAILPPLIAVINRKSWSSEVKGLFALAICIIAAAAVAWWERTLDWHNLRQTIPLVIAAAFGLYHTLWKPSGIAPAIEAKTG